MERDGTANGPYEVVVCGAGFGGVAAAARMREIGVERFTVLEEAAALGGTWRENTYPGCACDVPSMLYSYSFAPNPDWSRLYAPHDEILAYLERTADRLDVRRYIRFGCRLNRAEWNESERLWELATSTGPLRARWVISACGPLHHPAIPELPGIDTFRGTIYHSARWDHGHDLSGRRVGVLGTGASAIQIVPEIQPLVERLVVLQRTAQWVLPRPDRSVSAIERHLYRRLPLAQRASRRFVEGMIAGVNLGVRHPRLMRPLTHVARWNMHRHVKDPELRRRLSPHHHIGCKRTVISNRWYQALAAPNVTVADGAVREVRAHSIIDGEGNEHEIDTLVLATGYHAADPPTARHFADAEGVLMPERFAREGAEAYLATTVAGYPNLFLLTGPNSFVYSSIIEVIEAQLGYIADALAFARRSDVDRLEVHRHAQEEYNDAAIAALDRAVWATGCQSWFLDHRGRNTTMWPWSAGDMRRRMRRFDPVAYRVDRSAPSVERPLEAVLG